jgi:hypothetical protein
LKVGEGYRRLGKVKKNITGLKVASFPNLKPLPGTPAVPGKLTQSSCENAHKMKLERSTHGGVAAVQGCHGRLMYPYLGLCILKKIILSCRLNLAIQLVGTKCHDM